MFLIDNLLAAPLSGLIFVLKKINEAVQTGGRGGGASDHG